MTIIQISMTVRVLIVMHHYGTVHIGAMLNKKHPEEYANDKATWIQLFKDYTAMGMDSKASMTVISELFNHTPDEIEDFLRENGVIE